MNETPPHLEHMNTSELLQILSGPDYGHHHLSRAVPKERLIQLIQTREQPKDDELAQTTDTRTRLQAWIQSNWDGIGSQLPCTGPKRGQCSEYPCTEGRHLDCYLSAKKHML